jgi:hypothetical protein
VAKQRSSVKEQRSFVIKAIFNPDLLWYVLLVVAELDRDVHSEAEGDGEAGSTPEEKELIFRRHEGAGVMDRKGPGERP